MYRPRSVRLSAAHGSRHRPTLTSLAQERASARLTQYAVVPWNVPRAALVVGDSAHRAGQRGDPVESPGPAEFAAFALWRPVRE
jgi:hypothetical protein